MIESVEGIILNERDYGETSKILNILTSKYGIIGVMAKGCKSMKSDIRGMCDRLTFGNFHIYYKENKLSTLISVDIINSFRLIKTDILKISYASFLLDLTEQVMRQQQEEATYSILIAGLIKINEGYDPMLITNIVELKYLDFLGVMPVLDSCSRCGRTNSIATLNSDAGGLLCNQCRTNEPVSLEKTIHTIRMIYYVDISKISKLEIDDHVKQEINEFLNRYYDKYTGLYVKSKKFLEKMEREVK